MSTDTYSDILKFNKELGQSMSTNNRYEVAVLSNIMTTQLKEILEYYLRREGIYADVVFGDYDNIVQDSCKFKDRNCIIIVWELGNIIDGFYYKANTMEKDELEEVILKTKSEIDFVLANLKSTSLVLINKFSSLIYSYPYIRQNNLDEAARALNSYLEMRISANMILIDVDKVLARVSIDKSIDLRFYYSSKSLYSIDYYKEYMKFVKPIFMFASGKVKKAMIFDCDNTLWKGIVGEEGLQGISMSARNTEGIVYEEVQYLALELAQKGIIIGLCSKNNPEDVDDVIKNHSDMTLKDRHILIKKVNWDDKITNLKSTARELNIRLDSFVFVDDSEFEVNLVKEGLPEVAVLQVPKKLFEYPKLIRENTGLFFNISNTVEDKRKIQMYKEQSQREQSKESFNSIDGYLKSLELKVRVYEDKVELIPRMSQMTQKTNQFNLTSKRYTEGDIARFLEESKYINYALSVYDKFGDYGVVGLVIVELNELNNTAIIDSFLMSCRIIGRNIEYALFDFLVEQLRLKNINSIEAMYIKSPKNEMVANYYENLGFGIIKTCDNTKYYKLKIENYNSKKIDYVEITNGK